MAKGFFETLRELRGGATIEELGDKLAEVVKAVRETGASGEVKLTLKVKPPKRRAGTAQYLTIEDEVTFKMPQPDRGDTVFFPLADGSLSRQDPNQLELGLRAVKGPVVDADTGEVLQQRTGD